MNGEMSRRAALRLLGSAAGAAIVVACTAGRGASRRDERYGAYDGSTACHVGRCTVDTRGGGHCGPGSGGAQAGGTLRIGLASSRPT